MPFGPFTGLDLQRKRGRDGWMDIRPAYARGPWSIHPLSTTPTVILSSFLCILQSLLPELVLAFLLPRCFSNSPPLLP